MTDDLPYANLELPTAPAGRPFVFTNMVTTIDGKSVSGGPDEDVSDLGSLVDRQVMKRLERAADAIMAGAATIRASSRKWNPETPLRVVVTRTQNVPQDSGFVRGGRNLWAVGRTVPTRYLADGSFLPPESLTNTAGVPPSDATTILRAGEHEVDFVELLQKLRTDWGVQRLFVAGGSELNASLLKLDLVDEVFWTIAPKIKLGRNLPGYAGGEPLGRDSLLAFELVEHHAVASEIFARYRRCRPSKKG